jgi:ABC-type antimicrobial peptide transport system permease subunit
VRQLDPQMAATVATLGSIVEREGERLRPLMLYGVAAAVVALLLALSGVYAVVSFAVSQRVREIGIHMALGAQRRDVVLLVLRSALVPVIGGLIAGVGLATLAAAGTRSVLFGVNGRDPVTLTVLPLLLLGAAAIAVWIPARRAAALDPSTTLR